MPNKNSDLTQARVNKKDEFYTQYKDVETEVSKISSQLSGKIVYCPCDGDESNFTKFFKNKFKEYGLKLFYYSDNRTGCFVYDGERTERIGEPISIEGDRFLEIMDRCDVVVTNPPFSLFNDFLCRIVGAGKKFLIVGHQNGISCKNVFRTIVNNGVKVDYNGFKGLAGYFIVPDDYEDYATAGEHQEGLIRVSGVVWYTNMDGVVRNDGVVFSKTYCEHEDEYKVYDNFRTISGLNEDCINIDKVSDIPGDWKGYLGVPVSFISKYDDSQFEIVQLDHYGRLGNMDNVVDGKTKYRRIYIKRK